MKRRCFYVWSPLALLPFIFSLQARAEEADPLLVKIERQSVQSTHLASIGYHPKTRVLEVEFQNGDIYRYLDVPPAIVDGLRTADSKGRYFARFIRARYLFRLIPKKTP